MSIWDTYPDVSDEELRDLVAVTAQMLMDAPTDAETNAELLKQSPRSLAPQLVAMLGEPALPVADLQRLLEDEDTGALICRFVLDEVRAVPELADRVAAAYAARQSRMAVTESLLLVGALVILAIKIKEIKWGDKEKSIKFYQAGSQVRDFIIGLVKGPGL